MPSLSAAYAAILAVAITAGVVVTPGAAAQDTPTDDQSSDQTTDRDEDNNYVIDPDGEAGPAQPFTVEDPDFNFKSLRVNVVLRWEYRRGSTFYLVWTQDRVDFADPGDFDLSRDVQSLVDAPGDNIVMAKLNYWFGL